MCRHCIQFRRHTSLCRLACCILVGALHVLRVTHLSVCQAHKFNPTKTKCALCSEKIRFWISRRFAVSHPRGQKHNSEVFFNNLRFRPAIVFSRICLLVCDKFRQSEQLLHLLEDGRQCQSRQPRRIEGRRKSFGCGQQNLQESTEFKIDPTTMDGSTDVGVLLQGTTQSEGTALVRERTARPTDRTAGNWWKSWSWSKIERRII